MALSDDLQALIDESTAAATRIVSAMSEDDRSRPVRFDEFAMLRANMAGVEKAISALAVKVEELGSGSGGHA